jgi:hypothetical protein
MDTAIEHFKGKYCDSCKDISPRPVDWEYSDDWQEEENNRHMKFMAKFYQRRYGI